MKWVHAVVAAAFIGVVHASDEVELTRDVGSGFRMVIKSLPTGPGAFESVAQYHYLFYKDIELGQYDSYSVAPSGKYALLPRAGYREQRSRHSCRPVTWRDSLRPRWFADRPSRTARGACGPFDAGRPAASCAGAGIARSRSGMTNDESRLRLADCLSHML
jgi:hypothetical protein